MGKSFQLSVVIYVSHSSNSLNIEDLLAHEAWVRKLARQLVRDEDTADEVVQQTWLSVLEAKKSEIQHPKAWLARIVRNVAIRVGVAKKPREKEALLLEPANLDSPEKSFERAALQKEIVNLVFELQEPYREVVLLRFFEDLKPPEIAKRSKLPIDTVYTRLRRGLEQLRAKLDQKYGSRESWCLVALPWLLRKKSLLAVSTIPLGIAATLLLLFGISFRFFANETTVDKVAKVEVAQPAEKLAALEPTPTNSDRTALSSSAEEKFSINAQVLDVEGKAISGLACFYGDKKALSDEQGHFSVQLPKSLSNMQRLVIADPNWILLCNALDSSVQAEDRLKIIAAPAEDFSAVVIDEAGFTLEGVSLSVGLGKLTACAGYEGSAEIMQNEVTDRDGKFAALKIPKLDGVRIDLWKNGYENQRLSFPFMPTESERKIVLIKNADTKIFRGYVQDESGSPVGAAEIAFGHSFVKTDSGGHFLLEISRGEFLLAEKDLWVVKENYSPVGIQDFPRWFSDWEKSNREYRFTLRPNNLSIRGRVLADENTPASGLFVSIFNPTFLGHSWKTAEEISSGESLPVQTASDGSFVLNGLQDRDYELLIWDANRMSLRVAKVRAGEQKLEVRFPSTKALNAVHGRLMSSRAAALAGIQVAVGLKRFEQTPFGPWIDFRNVTMTDSKGDFVLEHCLPGRVFLKFTGGEVVERYKEIEIPEQIEPVERSIVAAQYSRLRLEFDLGSQESSRLQFLDAEGKALDFFLAEEPETSSGDRISGGSAFPVSLLGENVIRVSDEVREMLVYRDGELLAKIPIRLEPDSLNVVYW